MTRIQVERPLELDLGSSPVPVAVRRLPSFALWEVGHLQGARRYAARRSALCLEQAT